MPKCAQCGTDLPLIDAHALWREGKRICQNCAGEKWSIERQKEERRKEVDRLARDATRTPVSIGQTFANVLSLLGLAIILFAVFRYMPEYSMWAVVGAAVFLGLYHPWWNRRGDGQVCSG